jgi:elongation factor Ts
MIDYKKLKILRDKTGISISLCKKALEETRNNLNDAEKLLNKWGVEKVKDKVKKITPQGAIFSYVHHNRKIASLIELLCETDFVATNSDFLKLGQELAMQVASMPAKDNSELEKQSYVRDPSKKIADLIKEAIFKFGENIKIGNFQRWEIGESL